MFENQIFHLSEQAVEDALRRLCPSLKKLTWHENKSSFLSYREQSGLIQLRLHRLFLTAPSPVFDAIGRYVFKKDRAASRVIRQMAQLYFSRHRSDGDFLSSQGKVYDLQDIYKRMRELYFPVLPEIWIGWSSRIRVRKFRCITFGSFDAHRCQVRIHPLLDDRQVPSYFIEFIVYHELLHAELPAQIDIRGRFMSHTTEFRRRERQFPFYEAAKAWEKQSLSFFKKRISQHGGS